jgi:hypothetical protein
MNDHFELPSLEDIEEMEQQRSQAIGVLGISGTLKCLRCSENIPIVGKLSRSHQSAFWLQQCEVKGKLFLDIKLLMR